MVTIDDYYKPIEVACGYYESPCSEQQQSDIDWLSDEFDKLLEDIRCTRDFNSEWYYNSPHSGIHASTTSSFDAYGPCLINESKCFSSNLVNFWNGRYPRMRALYEFIERRECHLDDSPVWWIHYGLEYIHKRDRKYERQLDIAKEAYEQFVSDTLEELCDMYESNLYDACESDESEEAAQRWVDVQNESVFVRFDEHGNAVSLAIPIGGGWDVYEGQAAQDKYEAISEQE